MASDTFVAPLPTVRRLRPLVLFLLSVLVGAIASVGAWIFRVVIGKEMVVDAMAEALDIFSQQDSGARAPSRSAWATRFRRGG